MPNSNMINGQKTPSKANKSEIITIINNNLNYFNKKKNEEKKFVINTIRIPKSLVNLNNRLPESQYESDINNKEKKDFYCLSFQNNNILPLIRAKYSSIESINLRKGKNKRNNEKQTDLINSKSVEMIQQKQLVNKVNNETQKNYKERTNRFNQYNKFNTLKMIVDKKRPFNYKGKIDIIVEE